MTVTGGTVADGAVVTEHALACREIGRLSRGPDRQPEPESGGEQGERPGTRRQPGYSRTTNCPTTCAGCRWHLIGNTPALSAVKLTEAVLSLATTSFTPNAAIS